MQVNDRDFLAFEQFDENSPQQLWRVTSMREFMEKRVRHVNWFSTEEAARKHAAWLIDRRATDVYVDHYIRDEIAGSDPRSKPDASPSLPSV